MPTLSVWTVRLAFAHLVVGTGVGAVLLAAKAVELPAALWALRAFHVEALVVGFAVQLAVGVAYWILPNRRGAAGAAGSGVALAVVGLNAGVLLVGGGLAVAGRVAEAAAVIAFAAHAWARVRAPRAGG